MATITMSSTSSRIMSAASSSSSSLNDIAIYRTLPGPKSRPLRIPSKALGKWPSLSRSDCNSHEVVGIRRRPLGVSAQITELSDSKEGETSGKKSASEPRARLVAQRTESLIVEETARPLAEYMSLPASQYSVLDAERIERVDDMTFRCYVYRFQFFTFEVCPVLLVKVEEQHNGCCIRLLSCTLEGSPIVVAQNKKFSASMVNNVSWSYSKESSTSRQLISDTTIEVVIEIPLAFRIIPVNLIESTGTQVLYQLLGAMLPRFLAQLAKDYHAWASGDSSRRPLGTGEI